MTLATNYCIIRYTKIEKGVRPIKNRFKELRIKSGLSQKDVADALSISQVSVWQWENGDSLPRADKLKQISRLYHCTVDDLIGEDENS